MWTKSEERGKDQLPAIATEVSLKIIKYDNIK